MDAACEDPSPAARVDHSDRALHHATSGTGCWAKRALRARRAVEGAAFTRYLTTEGAFCEQARGEMLAGFDESRVPAGLRPLVPLARQLGVGDDACRGWFIRALPARERRAAKMLIAEHAAAIDAWLATRVQPHDGEAAAFFWLREAGEEL